jgi:hypothetical protein
MNHHYHVEMHKTYVDLEHGGPPGYLRMLLSIVQYLLPAGNQFKSTKQSA